MRILGGVTLVAVLAATGCSVGTSAAPATSVVVVTVEGPAGPEMGPSRSTPATTPGPLVDATGHGGMTSWASPSGNIACIGGPGSAEVGWNVRCDVLAHTWKLPPKPADCEFDWGRGAYIEKGRAGLTCVSDAVAGTDAPGLEGTWWADRPGAQTLTAGGRTVVALAYGARLKLGTILCTSLKDGMHCTDETSKHGFDIAREAYALR